MTRAKLVGVIPRALRLARPRADPAAAFAVLLDTVAEAASEFDVIHCHVDWVHLPLLSRLGRPFLTTLHGRLDLPGLPAVLSRFPEAAFISISDSQRRPLPAAHWLGTVYHGLPVGQLQPSFSPKGYLAFLGRITRDKGPGVAVRLARAAGLPLRMAAKIPRAENRYYKEHIEPLVDGDQIRLLGEVDDRGKGELLRNAVALLFPIDWPEPFGLVMIEAMACGTPVIAFRRGSVPEVIDHGISGFIVDSEEEALAAIRRVGALDRRSVRAAFESRFTARRMAEDYLRHYQAIATAPRPGRDQTELEVSSTPSGARQVRNATPMSETPRGQPLAKPI